MGFRLHRSKVQKEFNQFWGIDIKKLIDSFAYIQTLVETLAYQNEELVCDQCGKNYLRKQNDTKNKSGRHFCSHLCAKKFSSSLANTEEKKLQKSNNMKTYYKQGKVSVFGRTFEQNQQIFEQYIQSPKICLVCGHSISFEKRNCKTCAVECGRILRGKHNHETQQVRHSSGGKRTGSGRGKKGWYHGIWCDSSWELAWVIYNIEHDIKFERYNGFFEYSYKGKIHKYYPDFKLQDDTLVEIKGYSTNQWKAKLNSIPNDVSIRIMYRLELKPILDYVVNKYGKDFIRLYE